MKFSCSFLLLALSFSLGSSSFFLEARAADKTISTQTAHTIAITAPKLSKAISERISRVPEFEFIRAEAEKLGVKAYLFGGTAAAYAHYVKWDLQRENGDPRFQPDRFDYDYTNIYRSSQDLDIVIDGSAKEAESLQRRLAEAYPHFQGNKSAWEVRLLRSTISDKQALLDNPDFLNQHTDSNSTGMIEITHPQGDEPEIRDLRDWNSRNPNFLKDVVDGKLHYYFSPKHGETSFAKEGRNPPILSVVRFLTKAFQYELEIRPDDLAQVKKIIDNFDPHGPEMKNSYVRNWLLEKSNGKKLMQNAVNLDYAWKTLEELGLRKKLIAIESNPTKENSLAWWLNKEPLHPHPVGIDPETGKMGSGKTAREIAQELHENQLVVAHETNNFLAYESITRAHTGDPNVFISRSGATGEGAAHGNGFYTAIGRQGMKGTGLTIRFTVDPNAREGTDFLRNGSMLIFRNKNALRVIPESITVNPVELFRLFAEGGLTHQDRGLLEKLKRKISSQSYTAKITSEENAELIELAKQYAEKGVLNGPAADYWFSLPIAYHHPEIIETMMKKGHYQPLLSAIVKYPNLMLKDDDSIGVRIIDQSIKDYPPNDGDIIKGILSNSRTAKLKNFPHWIQEILQAGRRDEELLENVFNKPHSAGFPESEKWMQTIVDRGALPQNSKYIPKLVEHVLFKPFWPVHPEWNKKVFERFLITGPPLEQVDHYRAVINAMTHHPLGYEFYPEIVDFSLKKLRETDPGDPDFHKVREAQVSALYRLPHLPVAKKWEWVNLFREPMTDAHYQFTTASADGYLAGGVHWSPATEDTIQIIRYLVSQKNIKPYHLIEALSRPGEAGFAPLIDELIQDPAYQAPIAYLMLNTPLGLDHPEWASYLLDKNEGDIGGQSPGDWTRFHLAKEKWKERYPNGIQALPQPSCFINRVREKLKSLSN